MHWKAKAVVQNAISLLPRSAGDALYYRLQRDLGAFRALDRIEYFRFAAKVSALARARGRPIEGSTILEIGTGWDMAAPVALRLAGALRVITVDLNRHLRPELLREVVRFLRDEPGRVREVFDETAPSGDFEHRRTEIVGLLDEHDPAAIPSGIEYRAPADASRLDLPDASVDLHVSRSVLEHVPAQHITPILAEARRVLRPSGLLIHCVDFSDHFSHGDSGITSAHFLRFDEPEWKRWGSNRFMFHNRLRVDDFPALFREAGLDPLTLDPRIDDRARRELANGHALDARFRDRSLDALATVDAWFVAEKKWP